MNVTCEGCTNREQSFGTEKVFACGCLSDKNLEWGASSCRGKKNESLTPVRQYLPLQNTAAHGREPSQRSYQT